MQLNSLCVGEFNKVVPLSDCICCANSETELYDSNSDECESSRHIVKVSFYCCRPCGNTIQTLRCPLPIPLPDAAFWPQNRSFFGSSKNGCGSSPLEHSSIEVFAFRTV